jgi:RNA polymerase sigma-54 factor
MNFGMELRLRQHLTITPQIQQALRLLQLSSQECAQEIEQALMSNPFLEEGSQPPPPPAATAAAAKVDTPAAPAAGDGGEDAPPRELLHESSRSARAGDDEHDWTEWTEAPVSLREHLRNQLRLSQMGDRDRTLAHLVIDELSDAGYLETPLEELAALIAPAEEVEVQELSATLKLVQQLDPPGIAARSLQECLQLQLQALSPAPPATALALALVGEHFELLARREFSRLQQILGCDQDALHGARALIRTLNPRPGSGFAPDATRYVVPDVVVRCRQGHWVATLNPAMQPNVRINRAYADIAAGRNGCGPSFSRLLQEARWLLRSLEQRLDTIQRVADAIVDRQRMFFVYGEAAMKPMALKDIASELGLHESTVCRVNNGKYMATPRGLFEFKYFFSRQLATDDGGSCSAMAIRALLKELIAAENPRTPLSDAQLARMLAEQGLPLARRTVTKYRTLLRIPSVELRRAAACPPQPAPACA